MSVEFAQQTELARISKRACQTSTSMQTQQDGAEVEEREDEQPTPRASLAQSGWLEEVERERLERELEERNAEIRQLKEELQRNETAPEQVSVPTLTQLSQPMVYFLHSLDILSVSPGSTLYCCTTDLSLH